jgi:hypothetical protein
MEIIYILASIFVFVHLVKFTLYYQKNTKKDSNFLLTKSLKESLPIFIDELNNYCFDGNAQIREIDNTTINIYLEKSPQIIVIKLFAGVGYFEWRRMLLFGKEFVFKYEITHINEVTVEGQKKTAQLIIMHFEEQLKNFSQRNL